ncbi:MAG: c-type cytochrome [Gammaproteobacteria bacterium]
MHVSKHFISKFALLAFIAMFLLLCTQMVRAADMGVEEAGKARFMDYCAVCHGANAEGGGPFANMLKKQPSDLTMLSKSNGGTFPFDRVFESIDGRGTVGGAHGSQEMPIWGAEWEGSSVAAQTALRGRMLEMIIYLRSIQK